MANYPSDGQALPYGKGFRSVTLPVKAAAQIWAASMVSQISGACVVATTAAAGEVIGVSQHPILGGASDGAKRVTIDYDGIFIFSNGAAAVTDATPFGALVYAEDDHTVGLGGLGATQVVAGRFVGFEDNGKVRVYIGRSGTQDLGTFASAVTGTALTDTAATTIQRVGRMSRYLLAGTMSQAETITFGTTGAVLGDVIRVIRTSTSAQTAAFVNGGVGAGTLATLVASKIGFMQAFFDGTNWIYDGSSAT